MLQPTLGHMYLFKVLFSLDCFLRSWIARSYGSSVFEFLKEISVFSIVAIPIYIPINSVEGFPFLHTLTFIVYGLSDDIHSDW